MTVTQESNGWHVSVQFEAAAKVYASPRLPTVGIDAGLAELAVLSDGSRIAAPRLARKAAKHVRHLNRERDRRRKGSVNRRRTVARLARMHRRVRNARQNFLHQQSRKLVDRYSGFAVEDLALPGMARPAWKIGRRRRDRRILPNAPLQGRMGSARVACLPAIFPQHRRLSGVRDGWSEAGPR